VSIVEEVSFDTQAMALRHKYMLHAALANCCLIAVNESTDGTCFKPCQARATPQAPQQSITAPQ
jgi:hypothetical protein